MTEEQWLTCVEPQEMLNFVSGMAGGRKYRLFACACCRRSWNEFVAPLTIRVVMAVEMLADSKGGDATLAKVLEVALRAANAVRREIAQSGYLAHTAGAAAQVTHPDSAVAAQFASQSAALAIADAPLAVYSGHRLLTRALPPEYANECVVQADLVRDIFGNPFRSFELKPEWLTLDVLSLASGMYDSRDFGSMPILADALQDAGCDEEEVLTHCREAREHVRGCWIVDLLLGKQ
jgi:hypothetical protein